ncbi:hypothetical protein LSH36_656g01069 [Paralvinella palmiformis]|uniref:Uncharacterized protein n=1 Tax=Paralvinella palmiformis TaxID=53620 RepID=A0AAD9J4C3_9ANNE|nr:hypothetical protein LSH36_656g01069 [Paralvinella palmiformis]
MESYSMIRKSWPIEMNMTKLPTNTWYMEKLQLEQAKEMEEHLRKIKEQKSSDKKAKSERKVQTKDKDELERVKRNEERLAAEVAKLKREIERVHMTWEKKFAILQQSLHALKDESFLRQTMQRQAVQLHQAAISYAYDSPAQIAPTNEKSIIPPVKKPLPGISVKGQGVKSPSADYISYTVSAPSGRATTLFSADENQVMSDDEQDLPPDVCPLPSPPPTRDFGDNMESRPSTVKSKSSHVVVMPSANDQI